MNCEPDGLLIIGYGNLLRGDDGAGIRAASRLRDLGFCSIETHQLLPELAELVSKAIAVIFLDADVGVAAGEIHVSEIFESQGGVLEHHATPAGILRLAHDVYGRAPKAVLVGIGGQDFGYGEVMSDGAEGAISKAVQFCLSHSMHSSARGDGAG
jgi:hydrogenase maturation protease